MKSLENKDTSQAAFLAALKERRGDEQRGLQRPNGGGSSRQGHKRREEEGKA